MTARAIDEVMRVLEVPNDAYEARLKGMDMGWLQNSLVSEEYRGEVYWPTIEGITSQYFSPDTLRWLALVGRRIRPSVNLTDVTYPRALVVACAIKGSN